MITSFRAVRTSMARSVAGTLASSLAIAPSTRRCSFRDEVVLPGCSPFEVGEWFLATDASVPLASAGFRFLLCLLDVFRPLTFLPPFLELGVIYRSRWSQCAVECRRQFLPLRRTPVHLVENDRSVSHLFSPSPRGFRTGLSPARSNRKSTLSFDFVDGIPVDDFLLRESLLLHTRRLVSNSAISSRIAASQVRVLAKLTEISAH